MWLHWERLEKLLGLPEENFWNSSGVAKALFCSDRHICSGMGS